MKPNRFLFKLKTDDSARLRTEVFEIGGFFLILYEFSNLPLNYIMICWVAHKKSRLHFILCKSTNNRILAYWLSLPTPMFESKTMTLFFYALWNLIDFDFARTLFSVTSPTVSIWTCRFCLNAPVFCSIYTLLFFKFLVPTYFINLKM